MADIRRAPYLLVRYSRELWALAVCFYGFGDLVTTGLGLASGQVVEAGPLGVPVVRRYGMMGMVGLKVAVLAPAYGAWKLLPDPERIGVPLALATMGVLVTLWNALVLFLSHI